MTTQTNQLPAHITQALEAHEEAKKTYMEGRERLEQLAQRTERHRQAAAAAKQEAEAAKSAWREGFRQNDGELTKELRHLKHSELESRDLATELAALADEMQPALDERRLEVAELRDGYIRARSEAEQLYLSHALSEAAQTLFSQSAAAAFFQLLDKQLGLVRKDVVGGPLVQEAYNPFLQGDQEAIAEQVRQRQQRLTLELLNAHRESALQDAAPLQDAIFADLELVPASPIENRQRYSSRVFRAKERERLSQLKERQAQAS